MISGTLTAVGVDKTTVKEPFQWDFMVEHSISLCKQHPLVYKGLWELHANKESLLYPIIDF
jgi:hypothetical protein